MTAPADCSIPTKVLSIDHTFVILPLFFLFIIVNCNYGSLFRKCINRKVFLCFTVVYPKNSMNVIKTFTSAIICQCPLEKIQITLSKNLGNCWVLWMLYFCLSWIKVMRILCLPEILVEYFFRVILYTNLLKL